MADKYDAPKYPPPSHSPGPGWQSPPPPNAMVYSPNQNQYEMSRAGPQGPYYQQPYPQQGPYYGPPQGYGPGPGYPPQPPPQVVYERESSAPGICAGLMAGLACCCCLNCLF